MPEPTSINWEKDPRKTRTYSFRWSPKIMGSIHRRGLWSGHGSLEMGDHSYAVRAAGFFNTSFTITEEGSGDPVAKLESNWIDFGRNKLTLADGKVFYFRSFDIFRGAWSWFHGESNREMFVYRPDGITHKSGRIEILANEVTAKERDLLVPLGIHLQHFLNIWIITLVVILGSIIFGN